ncbi:MAG TPA: 2-iminoacetate synthase ThiH [Actinomycetota bacterium]|nr:2-iminoacetate synthase ThiH [Actinomycetota bacterium]
MTAPAAELLQLQRKAERERITGYEPEFRLEVKDLDELSEWSRSGVSDGDVSRALRSARRTPEDLAALISPTAQSRLEELAASAHAATVRRFGRVMQMFAPVYLSNECVSECTYCGFQVFNRDIVRKTIPPKQAAIETRYLGSLGFRHVLLVSGEHPKHVSADYVCDCIRECARHTSSVSVEVQAWDEQTYRRFVEAGCDGLVIYQEVYDPRRYGDFHLKGNKRFWGWRLGAPERALSAGMRRIGLGSLVGLNSDWRWEALALASHASFLMRRFWRSEVTVSLPRLEPATGFERPLKAMSDRELAQALAALRLTLPDAGIVLSTREPAWLRDGLVRLGVTHMSAGSRTEPGGYCEPGGAEQQFEVADHRPAAQVAAMLRDAGYDPVWKESSPALRRSATTSDLRI